MSDVDVAGRAFMADGEDAILDGPAPVEAPLGIDESLNHLLLEFAVRGEIFEPALAEGEIGLQILIREDNDLGGEAVAQGIEGGTLFTLGGAWAGC